VRSLPERLKRKFLSLLFGMFYPGEHVTFLRFRGLGYVLHTYGHTDIVSHLIWNGGIWEPAVAELIYDLCAKPHTTFVDIGSNLGTHTCIARLAGAKQIYAFECNPATHAKLESTVGMNGWTNVKAIRMAVSDREATLPFAIVTNNIGASFITTTHREGSDPILPLQEGVRAAPLDSVAMDLSGTESMVVKMDVEGHELQALRGMNRLLSDSRCRHVIIELNPGCLQQDAIQDILALLESHLFSEYRLIFHVPGDEWCGAEMGRLPAFPRMTRQDILDSFSRQTIMEVLFSRQEAAAGRGK